MQKRIEDFRQIIIEAESKRDTLVLEPLPYKRTELDPVLSEQSLDQHYGILAKSYVERFNKGEGDDNFNQAGAFLHNLFFSQLAAPSNRKPLGASEEFIKKHWDTLDSLKEEFTSLAMSIQGSGWIYLAKNGTVKTIKNHEIRNDIILLVDWWEHSWFIDYGADKKKYLNNIWRTINWAVINDRINLTH